MSKKLIFGETFLHPHPHKESQLGLGHSHVIVDKYDYQKLITFYKSNPQLSEYLEKNISPILNRRISYKFLLKYKMINTVNESYLYNNKWNIIKFLVFNIFKRKKYQNINKFSIDIIPTLEDDQLISWKTKAMYFLKFILWSIVSIIVFLTIITIIFLPLLNIN